MIELQTCFTRVLRIEKKHIMVGVMNPKDSNVYRKSICRITCDSEGVERGLRTFLFYKHAIPKGLASQKRYRLFISRA
jgi:hypothetical protein